MLSSLLRAFAHIGLAALFFIAPALCCCSPRLLARQFVAHSPVRRPMSGLPGTRAGSTVLLPPSPRMVQLSCCHVSEAAQPDSRAQHQPPATPQPRCDFCVEKSVATPPKSGPSFESPQPTGELIRSALLGLTTLPLEHLGLLGGLDPHEWTGVDTRSECLFVRHVIALLTTRLSTTTTGRD